MHVPTVKHKRATLFIHFSLTHPVQAGSDDDIVLELDEEEEVPSKKAEVLLYQYYSPRHFLSYRTNLHTK